MLKDVQISAQPGILGHALPEIVTCQPATPLTHVLKAFVEKKKHRIYVTARFFLKLSSSRLRSLFHSRGCL